MIKDVEPGTTTTDPGEDDPREDTGSTTDPEKETEPTKLELGHTWD